MGGALAYTGKCAGKRQRNAASIWIYYWAALLYEGASITYELKGRLVSLFPLSFLSFSIILGDYDTLRPFIGGRSSPPNVPERPVVSLTSRLAEVGPDLYPASN